MNITWASSSLLAFLLAFACRVHAQTPPQDATRDLGHTSWQLVKFQGSDDQTLTPDDPAKYTIAFDTDRGLSVRIDCNRRHGTWKSAGPNQLDFDPLALTERRPSVARRHPVLLRCCEPAVQTKAACQRD